MVRVDQDRPPAFIAGQVFRGFEQLPAHALALELGEDIQGEFGEVEIIREGQRDIGGADDLSVDAGDEDHLAFIGIRQLKQLFLRRVGQVVTAPRLHPHFAPDFDGGNEVSGVRPLKRIGDPKLLNPYIVCHRGHHPSRSATVAGARSPVLAGLINSQHMPESARVPSVSQSSALQRRGLRTAAAGCGDALPLTVVACGAEAERGVDGQHVLVFGRIEGNDTPDPGGPPATGAGSGF